MKAYLLRLVQRTTNIDIKYYDKVVNYILEHHSGATLSELLEILSTVNVCCNCQEINLENDMKGNNHDNRLVCPDCLNNGFKF